MHVVFDAKTQTTSINIEPDDLPRVEEALHEALGKLRWGKNYMLFHNILEAVEQCIWLTEETND